MSSLAEAATPTKTPASHQAFVTRGVRRAGDDHEEAAAAKTGRVQDPRQGERVGAEAGGEEDAGQEASDDEATLVGPRSVSDTRDRMSPATA